MIGEKKESLVPYLPGGDGEGPALDSTEELT